MVKLGIWDSWLALDKDCQIDTPLWKKAELATVGNKSAVNSFENQTEGFRMVSTQQRPVVNTAVT